MDMRHHARFVRDEVEQAIVHLHAVDRGEAQARQVGHAFQYAFDQQAERRRAGQVGAIAGDIDARQDDFAIARVHQLARLGHDRARRDGAAVPPAIGDDAEGAAMVAPILHLQKGAGMVGKGARHVWRGVAHGHDVGDANLCRLFKRTVRFERSRETIRMR